MDTINGAELSGGSKSSVLGAIFPAYLERLECKLRDTDIHYKGVNGCRGDW